MPWLSRGEQAASVRDRAERVRATAERRFAALSAFNAGNPAPCDNVGQWFASFETLAAWHDPSIGIFKMSTKTLRHHANESFRLGQPGLIAAMRQARERLAGIGVAPGDTIAATSQPLARGTEQVDAVLEISGRYLDLLDRMSRLAVHMDEAKTELRHHHRLHGEMRPRLTRVK